MKKNIETQRAEGYLSVAVRSDRRHEAAVSLDSLNQTVVPSRPVGLESRGEGTLRDKDRDRFMPYVYLLNMCPDLTTERETLCCRNHFPGEFQMYRLDAVA